MAVQQLEIGGVRRASSWRPQLQNQSRRATKADDGSGTGTRRPQLRQLISRGKTPVTGRKTSVRRLLGLRLTPGCGAFVLGTRSALDASQEASRAGNSGRFALLCAKLGWAPSYGSPDPGPMSTGIFSTA